MSITNVQFYDMFMKPFELYQLDKERRILLEDVAGDVLEIGFGTGVNFKHYAFEQLDSLTLLDIDLPNRLDTTLIPSELNIQLDVGDVQKLPYADQSFDSVVFTLVMCSVEDPVMALSEVYRVLKPGGRVFFMEHLLPTRHGWREAFNFLTPYWKRIAHGCHLNRETITIIQQSGLRLLKYHRFIKTAFAVGIAEKDAFL